VEALWSRASKAFPDGKTTGSGPEMSAELVEELKALGYLE
jgi:hypothetical protein